MRIGTGIVSPRPQLAARAGLTVMLVFLSSCATGVERFGVPIAGNRVAGVEIGRSTRADVLSLLGPPTFDSSLGRPTGEEPQELRPKRGETVFLWEYRERHEQFGTLLLYTFFSQRTLTDTLMVVIDERGVVSHVALRRETEAEN